MALCVSETVYLAANDIKYEDVDMTARETYRKVTKNSLRNTINIQFSWVKNIENIYSIVSFSSLIYTIVILSTQTMPTVDTVILAIYCFIVSLTQLPMVILCFLIAISPIICIILIIACCCCNDN